MADARTEQLNSNISKSLDEINRLLKKQKRLVRGIVAEYAQDDKIATSKAVRNRMHGEVVKEFESFGKDVDGWIRGNIKRTAKSFWGYARDDIDGSVIKWGQFSEEDLPNIIEYASESAIDKEKSNTQTATILAVLLWLMRTTENATINEGLIADIAGPSLSGGLSGLAGLVFSDYEESGVGRKGLRKLTKKEIAQRMREKLTNVAGEFIYIDAAGKRWTAENYFKMLNRTMHANAARVAYTKTATKAGSDLFVIAGGVTGSSKKYPLDPCDDWAGRVFSMSGQNGYPSYDDVLSAGVFHNNCVHWIRAA